VPLPEAALPSEQPSVADPVPLPDTPELAAVDRQQLPAGPPALAVALLVAAAVSTVAAGLRGRQP
jgi:hypothetical protein